MEKFIKEHKKVIAILLIWLFIQLIFLLTSNSSGPKSRSNFYPFSDYPYHEIYDLSEFLVYGLGPIIIIIASTIFFNEEK
jgi:hypothetical protein